MDEIVRFGDVLTGGLGVADVDRKGGVRRVRSVNRAQEMFLEEVFVIDRYL